MILIRPLLWCFRSHTFFNSTHSWRTMRFF